MRVRVRFDEGPRVKRVEGKNQHLAAGAAALLTPAAVMAGVLAVWRICADIGLTGEFAISKGFFSHWQVWLAVAAVLQILAFALNRYGVRRVR
ncbi:MAG: hypothetical protein LC126_27805 [Bryobacterales bacterium]|nr:hypothetical protein [Bryobacterales bacterium]